MGLQREEQVSRIKATLLDEMSSPNVDCSDIKNFLGVLSRKTIKPWSHLFITTNWDFLLQREILSLLRLEILPDWCASSHVYHLNGTVENLSDNKNRSPFILETDAKEQRVSTHEANIAFTKISWNTVFVVVGMSFECESDKFLLSSLSRVGDDLPIGESHWIIINPELGALETVTERIRRVLPHAIVQPALATFRQWISAGLPELHALRALSD